MFKKITVSIDEETSITTSVYCAPEDTEEVLQLRAIKLVFNLLDNELRILRYNEEDDRKALCEPTGRLGEIAY